MSELKSSISDKRIEELMDVVEEQISAPLGSVIMDNDELFDILYILFSHKFMLAALLEGVDDE